MIPDGTKVKHKTLNYFGYIDGVTRVKSVFTGNKDCEWQYRVRIPGKDKRMIAPEEDLYISGIVNTSKARCEMARALFDLKISEKDIYANNFVCIFEILLKAKVLIPFLYETNKWVYTKVRSKSAIRTLKRISESRFQLRIEGIGYDNRCRFCRTFRTAFKNKVIDLLGEDTFYQIGFCYYDEKEKKHTGRYYKWGQ